MIIIGENLRELSSQHNICNSESSFDTTCLKLTIGDEYISFKSKRSLVSKPDTIVYGEELSPELYEKKKIGDSGLIIHPKEAVLASSKEVINMPAGYMGFLQTTGSLARLFVSIHFCDGQVDPGFSGNITFEIFNASDYNICIRKNIPVGNMYIFKASTKNHSLYDGKYQGAKGPTIQKP